MKKNIAVLCALLTSGALFAAPDADLFLNPYVDSELSQISNEQVLNIGQEAADENVLFDRAVSVNVGCKLARTMQVISQDHYSVTGLGGHFAELKGALKEDGRLLVTAPASHGVVFTDGKQSDEEVKEHIEYILATIGACKEDEVIEEALSQLKGVHRATFAFRGDALVLVTDESELASGELIWRKTPEGAEQNVYHSEEEYLVALNNAGLFCEEIKRPCFFGNVKYRMYKDENDDLGEAYVENHPFTLYYVVNHA